MKKTNKISYPKISIITPSYNQGQFLEDTIRSVLDQNYPNLEYIIMDGGSTDNSADIIKKYEKHLSYWASKKDKGQTDAINKGFKKATGDILAWINSDDFYCPGALQIIADAYGKYPEAGLYTGNGFLVDMDGGNPRKYASGAGFDHQALLNGSCYILQPATFINRKAYEQAGPLDETLRYGMDLEYWLRISRITDVVAIDAPLANYRWYEAVKTNEGFKRWIELWSIYQRYTNKEITPGLLVEFFSTLKKHFVLKDLAIDVKQLADNAFAHTYELMQKALNLKDCIPSGKGIVFVPEKIPAPANKMEKTEAPAVIHSLKQDLRVDVVLQATGQHTWSVNGGWVNIAKNLGILHRAFTPAAPWGATEVTDDDGLWKYLGNPQADLILLLGFDWHSQMLHNSARWKERWRNAKIRKVLYAQESILNSCRLFENDLVKESLFSAAECVDDIVYADITDEGVMQETHKPFLWQPFGVDDLVFNRWKQFQKRIPRPFFRGQTKAHFTNRSYAARRELIEVLSEQNMIDVIEYKARKITPEEIVEDFNTYQIAVNFPSNFSNHPTRVYEAMACGCALITNRTGNTQIDDMFEDRKQLLYYDDKEELLDAIRLLSSDSKLAARIAQNGYEYTLENFTIKKHLLDILHWLNNSDTLSEPQTKERMTQFIRRADEHHLIKPITGEAMQSKKTIIIDGVVFYLFQNRPLGICRHWHSLLTELSHSPLAERILLLDRDGTAPFIPGIRRKTIGIYNHLKFEDDSLALEDICREENAELFLSTYYTYPENTHLALMLYDMIPELTDMDLSAPEWRAKTKAIEKAKAHFGISQSTIHDFKKLYPQYATRKFYLTYCAVSGEFTAHTQEEIDAFRKKYDIRKPYFMLSGKRSLYKNAALFFRAFSLFENKAEFEIICTGGDPELEKEFLSYLKGTRYQILFLSNEELSIAYSGAVALVYPSKYEGFGLPVLEANKSGCPVITCRNSSIPEVAGDAVRYVDEIDVAGMRDALIQIQQPEIRNELIRKGFENVTRFSWEKTGRQLVAGIQEILANLKGAPLNPSDPPSTAGRLFFILEKRGDCAELLTAMKELRKPHSDEDTQHLPVLLGYEDVIAGMKPDVFALFQQLLTETGEGDGFLYFCYALALEQRQQFDKALDAYLTARKKNDIGNFLGWRITYAASEIAYELGKLPVAKELLEAFLTAHPDFTEGKQKLRKIEAELNSDKPAQRQIKTEPARTEARGGMQQEKQKSKIRVSAIVSTYNAGRFIRGCLEDLVSQTLYEKGELDIIVVNSGSEQNEEATVKKFQQKYPHIRSINTKNRETIYAAWNRGIKTAKGTYITNANTDDRHRKDALEIMARVLDENPSAALVYGDQIITHTENETFERCSLVAYFKWPEFDRKCLLNRACIGPQPMWRRALHDEFGYFREDLEVAGDYEWWLRISEKYLFSHIPELLGLYLVNKKGVEYAHQGASQKESSSVRESYMKKAGITPQPGLYPPHFIVPHYEKAPETKPLVSVIIPTYNRPEMLKEAIRSVLNQTYRNVEIIVVNDAGQDVGALINEMNKDAKITYRSLAQQSGVAACRNAAIRSARGKYIAYLDDDDIYYPDHLGTLADFLEAGEHDAAYTDTAQAVQAYEQGRYRTAGIQDLTLPDFDYDTILVKNFIPTLCIMHKKSCLDETGLFDETLGTHEDWDLWIRMSRKFRIGHVRKRTCEFRTRQGETQMTTSKLADFQRTRAVIYERYKSYAQNKPHLIETQKKILEEESFPLRPQRDNTAIGHSEHNSESRSFGQLQIQQPLKQVQGDIRGTVSAPGNDDVQGFNSRRNASAIIVTFNSSSTIRACIDSVLQYTPGAEVIVVDNASADTTHSILTEYKGRITTILNKENKGFSFACNQGIRASKGEYVILLNPDTVVTPMWAERMLAHFKPGVGAVGPLTNYTTSTQLSSVYAKDVRNWETLKTNERAERLYEWNKGLGKEIKLLVGFCLALPRRVLDEVGLLDESLFLGSEDLEISWRLRQKGYRLVIATDTFIYHEGQVSFRSVKQRPSTAQSDRKLYEKLAAHYGEGNVPHPMELWGVDYFRPEGARFRSPLLNEGKDDIYKISPNPSLLKRGITEEITGPQRGIIGTTEPQRGTIEPPPLEKGDKGGFNDSTDQPFAKVSPDVRSLRPTFAAVYCVYDDTTWLRESIESVYDVVDALYFLIGDKPWFGQATDNKTTLEYIRTFPDPLNKIKVIGGTWTNETDQRNKGLDILKEAGIAYCFVIDADEIYDPMELKRMMELAASRPEVDCWHIALDTYWKSYRYRIEPREPLTPPVFIKIKDARFTQNRLARCNNPGMIPPETGICHHLSYARSDAELLKKITTFSHAHEVKPGWFENVWKRWDADHTSTDLHPTHPHSYQRAVEQPYSALPPALRKRYLSDEVEKTGGAVISGLTSIIILAHNQWSQTERCLESIGQHTPEPHEIIVVDNNSTDETRERLREMIKKQGARIPGFEDSREKRQAVIARSEATKQSSDGARKDEIAALPPVARNDEYSSSDPGILESSNPVSFESWNPVVKVISNNTNRGYAAGNNQGISIARGEYILLLNNDTVVTPGWLRRMTGVFARFPKTGVAGPMSNNVTRPQLAENADYEKNGGIDDFAEKWAKEHDGQSFTTTKASGFCLLTRREVIDAIGGLDEQFGSGNFEDDDFCSRAFLTGFEIRIVQDVFIHHEGSQTFKGAGMDYNAKMLRNWDLYKAKWDIPKDTPLDRYWIPSRLPETVSHFFPLPDLSSDHTVDPENRWWEDFRKKEEQGEEKVMKKDRSKGLTSLIVLLSGHSGYARTCVESIQRHTKEPHEILFVPLEASYTPLKWLRKMLKENKNYKLIQGSIQQDSRIQGVKGQSEERKYVIARSEATRQSQDTRKDEIAALPPVARNDQHIFSAPRPLLPLDTAVQHSDPRILESSAPASLSYAQACNRGLAEAKGEYLLILRDTLVVTEEWLTGMREHLNNPSGTGIVGPMSNVEGPQGIKDSRIQGFKDSSATRQDSRIQGFEDSREIQRSKHSTPGILESSDPVSSDPAVQAFAKAFRERNRYRRVPVKNLDSFCLLFTHALTEKIGLFDERFETDEYAADDYCIRAVMEGHGNVIAGDVFIHYYGSQPVPALKDRIAFGKKWSDADKATPASKKVYCANALLLADELNQKGQKEKAVATLVEGIKSYPEERRLGYALAEILIGEKKYKEALDFLTQMPPGFPPDEKRTELLGACTLYLGRNEEADRYADELLQQNNASAKAWNLKGTVAFEKKAYADAERFFQKAVASDRGFGEAYANIGALRWVGGKKEEALQLFEKAFILSPTVEDIVTNYYTAVVSLSQLQAAEKTFKEAIELYPFNRRLKFILTDNLLQQGKYHKAMDEMEDALAVFGVDDDTLSLALKLREQILQGSRGQGFKDSSMVKKSVIARSEATKQSRPARKDEIAALPPVARNDEYSSSSTGPLESLTPGTLSLCMIVKNEEKNIIRALRGAKPLVDEMIVVDTGSTDRTKKIAKAFGAKVYDFPWTNSFSDARNFSLSKATGDWILVLDADEVISALDYGKLRELVTTENSPLETGDKGGCLSASQGKSITQPPAPPLLRGNPSEQGFKDSSENQKSVIARSPSSSVIARSEATKQSQPARKDEIAALPPVARNDEYSSSSTGPLESSAPVVYSFDTRNYVGPVSANWHPNEGIYKEEAGSGWFPSGKVRLFPNDARIRFEKPVHEVVEDSLLRAGYEIVKSDIPIHHYGKLDTEEIRAKGEEYFQLGKKKLAEQGAEDPKALYELAIQASELEKYDEALEFWQRLIAAKPDFGKAYYGMGTSYYRLGRYGEARAAYKKAVEITPGSKDPVVMYATSELIAGDADAAVSLLDGLLRTDPGYPLALLAAAAAHFCAGRKKEGHAYARKVQETQFDLAPYLTDIAKILISVKQFDYAQALLEAAVETGNTTDEIRKLMEECYKKKENKSVGITSSQQSSEIYNVSPPLRGGDKREGGTIKNHPHPNPPPSMGREFSASLSLCMIVKDEEETIARALLSVKPIADEMIVVDTGSTDRTKEIAGELGAKVYDFPWTDSFSDARNFSISKATGDWILIVDADEVVSALDYGKLKELIQQDSRIQGVKDSSEIQKSVIARSEATKQSQGPGKNEIAALPPVARNDEHPASAPAVQPSAPRILESSNPAAFSFVTRTYVEQMNTAGWVGNDGSYPAEEAGTGWFPGEKVRLFPNDSRIRFEYPIHERVEPSLIKAGIEIRPCDIPVHHYGNFVTPEKAHSKAARYYQLGQKKIAESGLQNFMAFYELALQGAELGKHEEALQYLKQAIALRPDFAKSHQSMGNMYYNLGRYDEALLCYRTAFGLDPRAKDAVMMYATCEIYAGNAEKAVALLEESFGRKASSPQALLLLAEAYVCAGRKKKGLEYVKKLRELKLDSGSLFNTFAKILISTGRRDYALSILDAAVEGGFATDETRKMIRKISTIK